MVGNPEQSFEKSNDPEVQKEALKFLLKQNNTHLEKLQGEVAEFDRRSAAALEAGDGVEILKVKADMEDWLEKNK